MDRPAWPTITLGLLVAVGSAGAHASEPRAPSWSPDRAARAMDDRARAWLDWGGSKRRTGQRATTCVSCHTTLPFAMARGRLRATITATGPIGTPEGDVVRSAAERVAGWDDREVYYEGDRETPSRGTEAVVVALVLIEADRLHPAPSPATTAAIRNLWAAQRADGPDAGGWPWLDFGLEPFESRDADFFGASIAAYALGLRPADWPREAGEADRIAALRAYLRSRLDRQSLHNKAWLLVASAGMPALIDDAGRDAIVRELIAARNPDGGWSVSKLGPWRWSGDAERARSPHAPATIDAVLAESDGVGTGLATLALSKARIGAGRAELARGLDWLRAHQGADGRWPAASMNKDRDGKGNVIARGFAGDSATALAVMALLEADRR